MYLRTHRILQSEVGGFEVTKCKSLAKKSLNLRMAKVTGTFLPDVKYTRLQEIPSTKVQDCQNLC